MDIERRLESAAAEVRAAASRTAPPRFGEHKEAIRPWLAFSAAFAVVVAVVGIPYVLSNFSQGGPTDGGPLASVETTTSTRPETTTSAVRLCRGDLYPPTTAAYGDDVSDDNRRNLNEPARDRLTRIADAASSCDAAALAELASPDITTTFGAGSGPADIASWGPDDERFEIIVQLLNMTHGVKEMPDGSRLFVWPSAFAFETWDEIPDESMDELRRIYTQEEVDQISLLGSYGGWRLGITEAGEWIFFVAGD